MILILIYILESFEMTISMDKEFLMIQMEKYNMLELSGMANERKINN